MEVHQIAPGLWRWTAPHPDWQPAFDHPGGWGQMVGCVYFEAPDGIVLIDPLVPPAGTPDHDRFWQHLDRDIERVGQPLTILLGLEGHERSAQTVYDRYIASMPVSIWAHETARALVRCRVTDRFGSRLLPSGITAIEIGMPYPSEVSFYLPAHRTLVCADCIVGDGRLRLAGPPAEPAARARYQTAFRPTLRRLLDLPIDTVLPSHGAPVLQHGHAAIEEALAAPAWGEDETSWRYQSTETANAEE
ncbi:MAG TPA: hypothetical protein VGW38_17650 [Chloroflexota bacterium]|nr:hypothetical protein [Chloroflexota bacterium]